MKYVLFAFPDMDPQGGMDDVQGEYGDLQDANNALTEFASTLSGLAGRFQVMQMDEHLNIVVVRKGMIHSGGYIEDQPPGT